MRKFLYILFFLISALEAKPYNLCITAIFQNEAPYLKEWIEFHKLVGVQHFYLFNNLSTDEYEKVLQPYIDSGEVELFQVPVTCKTGEEFYALQDRIYTRAIRKSRKQTTWLAILDLDEFLFAVHEDNVANFLNKNFKEYAGVRVNWQMYGTSNVASIPEGKLMIEQLVNRARDRHPQHFYYKSIVRPECVFRGGIHASVYKPTFIEVNAIKQRMTDLKNGIHVKEIRINHYTTRDEAYYNSIKLPRLLARDKSLSKPLLDKYKNELSEVYDTTILRFVPKLRKRMGYE